MYSRNFVIIKCQGCGKELEQLSRLAKWCGDCQSKRFVFYQLQKRKKRIDSFPRY